MWSSYIIKLINFKYHERTKTGSAAASAADDDEDGYEEEEGEEQSQLQGGREASNSWLELHVLGVSSHIFSWFDYHLQVGPF